ncbi:hypothetical protein RFI_17837 [Reticulomyxa filosa]|uniref:Uncharacterized protein n=1 Tax=Reticulomyxa filosa TaxID=46433 RepID=X6N113_RETFI|nr:hypothetical protein RFI_17837 [Reticulomyxa filosa]|eukprot:ETO19394.1 hypothetical protein RFI_17837 [Reticulomyxa filosa]
MIVPQVEKWSSSKNTTVLNRYLEDSPEISQPNSRQVSPVQGNELDTNSFEPDDLPLTNFGTVTERRDERMNENSYGDYNASNELLTDNRERAPILFDEDNDVPPPPKHTLEQEQSFILKEEQIKQQDAVEMEQKENQIDGRVRRMLNIFSKQYIREYIKRNIQKPLFKCVDAGVCVCFFF